MKNWLMNDVLSFIIFRSKISIINIWCKKIIIISGKLEWKHFFYMLKPTSKLSRNYFFWKMISVIFNYKIKFNFTIQSSKQKKFYFLTNENFFEYYSKFCEYDFEMNNNTSFFFLHFSYDFSHFVWQRFLNNWSKKRFKFHLMANLVLSIYYL